VEYTYNTTCFEAGQTLVSSKQHPASQEDPASAEAKTRWERFLTDFFANGSLPESSLQALFEPMRAATVDSMVVVGQLGQTMDGRIATVTGQSKYINGHPGLTHLHQMRALLDTVVVGVGTVLADDPLLNVRLVSGKHPARVVIDPKGKLDATARIWTADGARRLWLVMEGVEVSAPEGVEVIALPATDGRIAPKDILSALAHRGLKRILIEGGAETVSRFLQAGCLDRLHLIVAPILMGSGRASLNLPAIEHMDQALRLNVHTHQLGNEVLFDCDLSPQRVKVA
jgi:diaminohydroxyphosphoribosylaminopyrimidine deaminase/5-amino-6-(5-phosphoribosylamino)uracil reductase